MANRLSQKLVLKSFITNTLYAYCIIVLFQTFLYQPFKIPSSSMEPNLRIGDYLIVKKFSYGYNHSSLPFYLNHIYLFNTNYTLSAPKRGDIIVFLSKKNDGVHYVKRIIGLPGDIIQIHDGDIYINNNRIIRKYLRSDATKYVYLEVFPNGTSHIIYQYVNDPDTHPNSTVKYIIPSNRFFVMGDNRDNSLDSRFLLEMGYINKNNILGKVQFLLTTREFLFFSSTNRILNLIK